MIQLIVDVNLLWMILQMGCYHFLFLLSAPDSIDLSKFLVIVSRNSSAFLKKWCSFYFFQEATESAKVVRTEIHEIRNR